MMKLLYNTVQQQTETTRNTTGTVIASGIRQSGIRQSDLCCKTCCYVWVGLNRRRACLCCKTWLVRVYVERSIVTIVERSIVTIVVV